MKTLITCHNNADFDAFAAMLAARKIYENADLFFPGSQEIGLSTLYKSLDKKDWGFIEKDEFNPDDYDKLVLVDTRQRSRVKHARPLLDKLGTKIEIWDHHPSSSEDIENATLHYAQVGAVTTLLCNELANKNYTLTPEEATYIGIGIYADTGSFTYSSTTDADFKAAAWLLGQGMKVSKINEMACNELTSAQVMALNSLLESIRTYRFNNVEVAIAEVDLNHYLGDFALLAHKIMEMEKFGALFAIASMGDRIQVVARSRDNAINVGEICAALGGGGHIYAASASFRFASLEDVKNSIVRLLHEHTHPEKTAADYMTSPAIGIESEATIKEADELMLHFGLKALPVFKPGTRSCLGLLDAQTAARANSHGLANEKISEYMQRRITTLPPSASIRELADVIVGGRQRLVPIMEHGNITGVVTRTDLINVFANECESLASIKKYNSRPRNVSKMIRDRLPPDTIEIMQLAGRLGLKLGLPVYAVGGFVRDLLLGYPNHDIDLVAEGNGIALARALAQELGGRVREHAKFLTSVVIYHDAKGEERHIDVATARLEYYEYPAALPTVELSSIKMDLFRRDFSINALAIRLDGEHYGNLADFFGGRRDIKDGLIRVLHTLSFVEDPTRCIRAVRFEQRYDFRIGPGTEKLIKNMLPMGVLEKLSAARLFNEFKHLCDEEKAAACLLRLENLGILKTLDASINITPVKKHILNRLQELLAWYKLLFFEETVSNWICYFYALCQGMPYKEASDIYKHLGLPTNRKSTIMKQREEFKRIRNLLLEWQERYDRGITRISEFCEILQKVSLEALLYIMASIENAGLEKNISRYITQWQREKADISGSDLLRAGVRQGPLIGKLLKKALQAKLDGKAPSPKSQLSVALEEVERK